MSVQPDPFKVPRGCGKAPYPTRALANKARSRIKGGPSGQSGSLETYRCQHCGTYHLGRNPRARRQPRPVLRIEMKELVSGPQE